MNNKNIAKIGALACAMLFFEMPSFAQDNAEPKASEIVRTLSISGNAELDVVPDEAKFFVGVQSIDKNSKVAMDNAAKTSAAIYDVLKAAGINEDQISTDGIRLQLIYTGEGGGLFGKPDEYSAENSVRVTVKQLDILPDLLANLADAGANDIGGLEFDISNREEREDEAMLLAVDNAHDRAAKIAERAGMSLGDPIQIKFGNPDIGVPVVMEMAASFDTRAEKSVSQVSVSPGTITLRSYVDIQYELDQRP